MKIEVGSLKELEKGKTYALQTSIKDEEKLGTIMSSIRGITEAYDIYFVLFDETVKLIDAPVAVGKGI